MSVGSGGWAIILGTVTVDTLLALLALVDMALSLVLDLFTRYDRGGGGASGKSSSERSIEHTRQEDLRNCFGKIGSIVNHRAEVSSKYSLSYS